MQAGSRHQCIIYENSPADYLGHVASIAAEKLKQNHRCLYLNSPAMVAGMRSYLAAHGISVAEEIQKGSLLISSDDSHLFEGRFHVGRMIRRLAEAVKTALQDGYRGLWATGDMSWEFGSEKNFDKLLEYEQCLERLFAEQPALSGICQYHREALPAECVGHAIHIHPHVYINDTLLRVNSYYLGPELRPRTHSAAKVAEMLSDLRRTVSA